MFLCLKSSYYLRKEDLEDAVGGAAVPAIREGGFLPGASHHLSDSSAELLRILAHKDIRTHRNRLLMLRVVVERDTRHAVERSLLSDITRVGDDALGLWQFPDAEER